MKSTVYLIHGFRERQTETIFRLGSYFEAENHPVVRVDYGYTNLISVRFATSAESTRLAKVAKEGSIAIGHSNGFAIIYDALLKGAKFSKIIGINPALKADIDLPVPSYIYHSPDDYVVTFAKYLRYLSPLRLIRKETKWGEMGRTGYKGKSPFVTNINLLTLLNEEKIGHGGAFRWDRIDKVARDILQRACRESSCILEHN
jgi:hypothetical protein